MSDTTSRPRNANGTINWSAVAAAETPIPIPPLPDDLRPATQTFLLGKVPATVNEAEVVRRLARAFGEMTPEQIAALTWTQKIALAQGKSAAEVIAKPAGKQSVDWTRQCEEAKKGKTK
jgi:hypothetical protein